MKKYFLEKKRTQFIFIILIPIKTLIDLYLATIITNVVNISINGRINDLKIWLVYSIIYLLVNYIVTLVFDLVKYNILENSMASLKHDMYHCLVSLNYSNYQKLSSGELFDAYTNDVDIVRDEYYFTIFDMIIDTFKGIAALILLFSHNYLIGFFVIFTILLQITIPLISGKKMEELSANYSESNRNYLLALNETNNSFIISKVFNLQKKLEDKFLKVTLKNERNYKNREFAQEKANGISFILNQMSYIGVFVFGSYLVLNNKMSLGEVVAVTSIVDFISGPALYFNDDLIRIKSSKNSINNIERLLKKQEDTGRTKKVQGPFESISISNLCFNFEDKNIVENFNLEIEKNKKYLIKGKSGVGKSTLLKLIESLYTEYQGNIKINNVEVKEVNWDSLANYVCYIDDNPYIFNDTLLNNLTLYDDIDEKIVTKVIKETNLDELVNQYSDGLNHMINENGNNLSAGQKQRIAIARGLIRQIPVIMIDEGTSHLDQDNARDIEEVLSKRSDITLVIVSHNPSDELIDSVDQIIEM